MHELARGLHHDAHKVSSLTWQSQSTASKPGMASTWELEDVGIEMAVPGLVHQQQALVKPNLPWAEMHFNERISGIPMNPPPSHELWPFAQSSNQEHREGGKFSHTYPERFWPKHGGLAHSPSHCSKSNTSVMVPDDHRDYCDLGPKFGLRFAYGDLSDVVNLLVNDPTTRQAYLPVWFPEDTGAVSSQRVPCTLGYQFRIRNGRLNCTYGMRSCDYLRHMRDDIYMAMRLMRWVADEAMNRHQKMYLELGSLAMFIGSLHIFEGDRPTMKDIVDDLSRQASQRMMEAMSS